MLCFLWDSSLVKAAVDLWAHFSITGTQSLACRVLWVPVANSGRDDLLTVGACPQKQGIPGPPRASSCWGRRGSDSAPAPEGELGRLLGSCHRGSCPGLACQGLPRCLPTALARTAPLLAAGTVCIICTRGLGASEVQIHWEEISLCLVLPVKHESIRH